jgi:hypothetical protein
VVKARQLDFPRKVWSLAQAGDLAARADNAVGGKKVLLEAADLAAKLVSEENSHNSLAVGMVAARLAPHDWPRAEALLNGLKGPDDFNRYLAATAGRLARTDYPKAKELLTRFKPDNSSTPLSGRLRVAFAIAKTQPDEAVKIVDAVEKGRYRFQGYVQLALILAPTDKARAVKLIDTAYDHLDRDPQAFNSWSNYGGRAGMAVVGLLRAKEIGYPDLSALVARTLAMRSTVEDGWSPGERGTNRCKIAAALALVDPAAARHLLGGVVQEEFVEQALSQRREWLMALALSDPERAIKLADRLIERAKTTRAGGRNPLSETGLVETCSILTSSDRLGDLASYASLPREIGDDD